MRSSADNLFPDDNKSIIESLRAAADRQRLHQYEAGKAEIQQKLNAAISHGAEGVVEAVKIVLSDDWLINEAFKYYVVIRDKSGQCEDSLAGLYGEDFSPEFLDGKRFNEIFNLLDVEDGRALDYASSILAEHFPTRQQREMVVLVAVIFYIKSLYKMILLTEQQESTAAVEKHKALLEGESASDDGAALKNLEDQCQHILEDSQRKILTLDINIAKNLAQKGVLLQFAILLNNMSQRRYSPNNYLAQEQIERRNLYLEIIDGIATSELRCDPLQLSNSRHHAHQYYFTDCLFSSSDFNELSKEQQCVLMYVLNDLRQKYTDQRDLDLFLSATQLLGREQIDLAFQARGEKAADIHQEPEVVEILPSGFDGITASTDSTDEVNQTVPVIVEPVMQGKSFFQKYRNYIIAALVVLAVAGLTVGMAASFGALGVGVAVVVGCAVGYSVAGTATGGAIFASIKSYFSAKKSPGPASASQNQSAKVLSALGEVSVGNLDHTTDLARDYERKSNKEASGQVPTFDPAGVFSSPYRLGRSSDSE